MFCSWLSVSNAVHKYKVRIKGIHNDVTSQVCFDSRSKFHHFYHSSTFWRSFQVLTTLTFRSLPLLSWSVLLYPYCSPPLSSFAGGWGVTCNPLSFCFSCLQLSWPRKLLCNCWKCNARPLSYICILACFYISSSHFSLICNYALGDFLLIGCLLIGPISFAVNNCSFDQSGSITDK